MKWNCKKAVISELQAFCAITGNCDGSYCLTISWTIQIIVTDHIVVYCDQLTLIVMDCICRNWNIWLTGCATWKGGLQLKTHLFGREKNQLSKWPSESLLTIETWLSNWGCRWLGGWVGGRQTLVFSAAELMVLLICLLSPSVRLVNFHFKSLLLLQFLFDHSEIFTRETKHMVPPCNKA